jgi:predicted DNA-binding transcriptional regulator AlpA
MTTLPQNKHKRAFREVALNTSERPQPIAPTGAVRLIERAEVLDKVPLSYATIWSLMRAGAFPRSRVVGDRSFWVESEVDAWIAALPQRALKGDADKSDALSHRPSKSDDTESAAA